MDFKVIFTPQSLKDLEEIVSFISQDDPERARAFGNELIDCALKAASLPELGGVVPELGKPAVREIVYGLFRIIYEKFPEQKRIYLLRVWHGYRDEPKIISRG